MRERGNIYLYAVLKRGSHWILLSIKEKIFTTLICKFLCNFNIWHGFCKKSYVKILRKNKSEVIFLQHQTNFQ